MAGEAQSNAFMLGTATIMVGPVADLYNLNPAQHSLGLAKNVMLKSTPSFTDLTQGVKNNLVFSVQTANEVELTGELYEYTSKNLTYNLGLDGSSLAAQTDTGTVSTLLAAPTPPALTAAVLAMAAPPSGKLAVTGQYVMVQIGSDDNIYIRKVVSVASSNLTLDRGFPVAIPVGTKVIAVNVIPVGSKADSIYVACKIVGTIADGTEIVVLIPKLRITSGVSLGFKSDSYDFQAFSGKLFDLVTTDPFYADFLALDAKAAIFNRY